jgi:hypothetical protein
MKYSNNYSHRNAYYFLDTSIRKPHGPSTIEASRCYQ